jgi:8-oxo-dGTP pyrophosphatase MutT (NUDIX family)
MGGGHLTWRMDLALDVIRNHDPVGSAPGEREAAVLVPIVERDGEPHLLFIKRADHLGEHAGQMSFPGGGREPSDETLLATALREANEEVGMDADGVEVIGRLDDIGTVSSYSVRPFVARVPDQTWVPDEREVAEVVVLPLVELTALSNYESERRDHPHYGEIRLHFFHVDGYTVWGATGRMLVQFLELATGWEMPPEVDRVVDPDAEYPV